MGASKARKLLVGAAVAVTLALGVTVPTAAAGEPSTQDQSGVSASDVGTQDIFRRAQVSVYAVDVAAMIDFYALLGFTEQYRIPPGDPHPMFATIQIDGFFISLADYEAMRYATGLWRLRPAYLQDSDVTVLVDDVDATVQRVRDHGGVVVMEPREAMWGERFAYVEDPSGHYVQLSTHRTGFPTP